SPHRLFSPGMRDWSWQRIECIFKPMRDPDRSKLVSLEGALRRRLDLIADHGLRDADPAAHLEGLKGVSEEISRLQQSLAGEMPPRLEHFLVGGSYGKALAWIEEVLGGVD
ncbi:MAG: hypothetical protein ACC661_07760, partial [Verrucomicrobiales bacterium]